MEDVVFALGKTFHVEGFPKSKNIEVGHLPRLPCIFHFFQVCKGLRRMVQPRRIFVSPSMHGRRGFCSWENLPRGRFSQEQKYRGRPSSTSSMHLPFLPSLQRTTAYGPTSTDFCESFNAWKTWFLLLGKPSTWKVFPRAKISRSAIFHVFHASSISSKSAKDYGVWSNLDGFL